MDKRFKNLALKAADRVVVPKSDFSLIQHHVIFLGYLWGDYWIAENKVGTGVCVSKADDFFTNEKEITKIERFQGTDFQRQVAVKKALSLRGKEYDLINFNCEHYSNLVQYNELNSSQITNAIGIGLLAFSAWALTRK